MSRYLRWLVPVALLFVWLGAGGWLSAVGGNLGSVEESGTAAYLPHDAEASEAARLDKRFGDQATLPAIVVYSRPGGLTPADTAAIRRQARTVGARFATKLAGRPIGPRVSTDRAAAELIVPFAGSDENAITPYVPTLRAMVAGTPQGLAVQVTGPAGVQADMQNALGAIDLLLVLVTGAVILTILILVYRSPLLPLLVLAVAGVALGVTQGVIYLLAEHGVLSLGSEVEGILDVLVLGAGTDYALLMVSRYREALREYEHRSDAMWAAWRRALVPIAASGGTVMLGLLCLLISDLSLDRGLGPAGAIGIACALAAMLTLLPAVLALLGRAAFWPRKPRHGSAKVELAGRWSKLARFTARRPRPLWIGVVLVLAVCALGLLGLNADGIPQNDMVIGQSVESRQGQQQLDRHFPAGSGSPVIVIASARTLDAVVSAAERVPGVASVEPFTGTNSRTASAHPMVVGGLVRVDVTLSHAPDSDEALTSLHRLRAALADIPGANARAGGYTAELADFNDTAVGDRKVIPLLLIVVCIVVALLLRALVAPLLLLATVVLSYLAAIGTSVVVFRYVFGFSAVDATFPLQAFVFLVALGIDYNIFLMTRVREESARHGTRQGMVLGLALTGGVITSAGVVLAATFAALAVIPLVILAELAFTVAFGVLLDTFVVRSLLVPALTVDVGRWMWWPSRLARSVAAQTERTPHAEPVPRIECPPRREPEWSWWRAAASPAPRVAETRTAPGTRWEPEFSWWRAAAASPVHAASEREEPGQWRRYRD